MTPSRPRTTALRLEALPARDVPAVVTVGGTLYIEGTDFADDVRVEHDPGVRTVRVYLTSHTDQGPVERKYQFSDGNINHLTFVGRGGDDRFVNRWAAPGNIKATGGDGDDTLASVSSAGAGRLYLYGDGGKDVLKGGDRDDFLDGGQGWDWLEGGDGNDYLDGGFLDGEDDVLLGGLGADQFRAEAYVDPTWGVMWYAPPFTDFDPAQGDWISTW